MYNEKQIKERIDSDYNFLNQKGYEVIGVFLQGSQNYNLSYEDSDIDTKAIVLPSFKDFLSERKQISLTHVLPSNEHIDIKDIRSMFTCFKKQNINFVEILFTKYFKLNPKYEDIFIKIMEKNEEVSRYNNYAGINCMVGMACEKQHALEHKYPSTIEKIEEYGYDSKQLCHIIRMDEFLTRFYIKNEKYKDCLIPKDTEYLINVKRNIHSLDEARVIAERLVRKMIKEKEEYMKNNSLIVNKEIEILFEEVIYDCMKLHFKTELEC